MTITIASDGGATPPSDQLHRLCVHYIGGAGGGHEAVSSHYRSGLQLLTSSASHGHAYPGGGAGERAVVERISKHLVRSGRDRDAVTLDSLVTKLTASSRDILKNRASILTLLYSLSKDAGSNKENQVHICVSISEYICMCMDMDKSFIKKFPVASYLINNVTKFGQQSQL